MKIKALLFDFDECILINEESTRESVRQAWKQVEKEFPNISSEKVVDAYMETRDKFWHVTDDIVIPIIQKGMEHTRRHLWNRTLNSLEIHRQDLVEKLIKKFSETRIQTWQLYPEAEIILMDLKKIYHLVMITNGVIEVQQAKIKKTGMEKYFEKIFISGELGISKPDARFFHLAADSVKVKYNECLVIGDSLRNDIGGAKNAGMVSVWINRNIGHPDISIQPDYVINSLDGLPPILKSLG